MKIYTEFLAEYTIRKFDDKVQESQLSALYSNYLINHGTPYTPVLKNNSQWAQYVTIILLFALIAFGFIIIKSRNKHHKENQNLVGNLNTIKAV